MRVKPADLQVIAVRGSTSAAFAAVPVIGRTGDGRIMELGRVVGGEIEGVEIPAEQLDAAVRAGDVALLSTPVAAQAGMVAWLVGPEDVGRVQELFDGSGCPAVPFPVQSGAGWLVVRPIVDPIRQALHREHLDAARGALRTGDVEGAGARAWRAWLTAQPVDAVDVAVLIRAWELAGRTERAHGLREMERKQRGDVFDRLVEKELASISRRSRTLDALRRQQEALAA